MNDHPPAAPAPSAAGSALAGAVRLSTSVDALAALAAHLRLETEGLPADPAVRSLLAQVAAEVLGDGAAEGGLDAGAAAPIVGMARAFLSQGAELVENPGRSGGWDQVDERLLQGIGRVSMAISDAVAVAQAAIPELGAALTAPGATFLDVGTGAGWLAIAMARARPGLRVVGIDVFGPALQLARRNVAAEGLTDRIELREQDAATLTGAEQFTVVWLPMPFLPAAVVPAILDGALRAVAPGGWLVAGTFTGTGERLSDLLMDLRTVRSGGHPWAKGELVDLIAGHGFASLGEVQRRWPAPVRLFLGRKEAASAATADVGEPG